MPEAARNGLIIFLNGTSSSGKSSIAEELLEVLDEPSFHLPVDAFHAMRTRREVDPEELPAILRRTWMGFHRAVAGMAAAGNNVVVDHVLSEEWRLLDCLELFTATPCETAPRPDGPRSRGRRAVLTLSAPHILPGPLVGICGAVGM
ncbi:AAA family ATPase [Streptomyces sp. CRPSP2-6A1]|nr:AAA family ATPase [Streptomyces sp. CRPSP2-6A1]